MKNKTAFIKLGDVDELRDVVDVMER